MFVRFAHDRVRVCELVVPTPRLILASYCFYETVAVRFRLCGSSRIGLETLICSHDRASRDPLCSWLAIEGDGLAGQDGGGNGSLSPETRPICDLCPWYLDIFLFFCLHLLFIFLILSSRQCLLNYIDMYKIRGDCQHEFVTM